MLKEDYHEYMEKMQRYLAKLVTTSVRGEQKIVRFFGTFLLLGQEKG